MAADLKMYCIFSQEALEKMRHPKTGQIILGKLAAQAGHAYLHAWWDAVNKVQESVGLKKELNKTLWEYYGGDDARKICLVVPTDDDLRRLVDAYRDKTGVTLVEDCGYTVFTENTVTCAGIGPLLDEDKGDDLRSLSLLS